MAFAVTNAGITNFNPLIISGYGFSETKTTLMAAPQAAVAMVAQTVATLIMLYMPNMRCLLWSASMLPAIAGTVMIHGKSSSILCLQSCRPSNRDQCSTLKHTALLRSLAFIFWAFTIFAL